MCLCRAGWVSASGQHWNTKSEKSKSKPGKQVSEDWIRRRCDPGTSPTVLHSDIKEVSMFMLRTLTVQMNLELFYKLLACVFLFLKSFRSLHVCYLCLRVINLFPFIIYVIENVIYVSMNFELRPIQPVINLSPKPALSVHSYTLWLGPLINLPKLEVGVHAWFSLRSSLAKTKLETSGQTG